jgi:transposase
MVYDNLKAVVETIFTGKERLFNRRFMVLANHYLFEPVACTPASGWEKGQVENQVGNIREWLFMHGPVNSLPEAGSIRHLRPVLIATPGRRHRAVRRG